MLAVFLLYTSIAGGGTPTLQPSQLAGHTGRVSLIGQGRRATDAATRTRAGSASGSATSRGRRAVPVVYTGSVPDLFRDGRDVVVDGTLRNGVFVARAEHARHEVPVEVHAEADVADA